MAESVHDVLLLQGFSDDPSSLRELVTRLTGRRLPHKLQPMALPELLGPPDEACPAVVYRAGRSWLMCVVLSEIDNEKRSRWQRLGAALYGSMGRTTGRTTGGAMGRMGEIVVITASEAVARWARRTGPVRGCSSLGTEISLSQAVFQVKERDAATLIDSASPGLAVCAVWAMREHGGPLAWSIVEAAIERIDRLAEPLRDSQLLAIFNVMGERMQSRLCEDAMNPKSRSESPMTRTLRLRMEAAGVRNARPEIRAETKREGLMMLLAERGLRPSAEERGRIEACDDALQLDAWFKRAIVVETVAEVLGA